MKGEFSKLKILHLKEILEEESDIEHYLSMEQILEKLEARGIPAERKSVYSDLKALEQFGCDIEHQNGKNGGYCINTRQFEQAEVKLLIDALQASKFITQKKTKTIQEKLASLMGNYTKKKLLSRTSYSLKSENESILYGIDEIHTAINENKKIRFQYMEWCASEKNDGFELVPRRNGEYYVVSPAGLWWDNEFYYLVGIDDFRGSIRHYRLDKMKSCSVVDEKRNQIIADIDMTEYSKRIFDMYGGDDSKVTIRFDKTLIGVVIDKFGKNIVKRTIDENTYETTVSVAVSPTFFSWVFTFGGRMTVISPSNVVDAYLEHIENLLKSQKSCNNDRTPR
ncbi:MAG: WYL domain-containing protein [Clostridia bacterium]|nr:WYL domain-containing protein [Clostridia bacterium]